MIYAGTFSEYAPVLWRMGWRGLLPLQPGSKAPACRGWGVYCHEDQTLKSAVWAARHSTGKCARSGVGQCAGNGVVALDLDILHPEASQHAVTITKSVLGPTSLHRVGKPPKAMLFYRGPEVTMLRRNPGGLAVEIYPGGRPASGQVVLFGEHPAGYAYHWPHGDPREIPLSDIPEVTPAGIDALVSALSEDPLIQAHGRVAPRSQTAPGIFIGSLPLQAARRAHTAPGGLPRWLREADPGGRHYAALAACVVVVSMGLDTEAEDAELECLADAFADTKPDAGPGEWARIVSWAERECAPKYRQSEVNRRLGLGGGRHG